MATSLDATKRQLYAVACTISINVDLTAVNTAAQAGRTAAIFSPNAGYQTIVDAIRQCNRVFFIHEENHRKHKAEHFVECQGMPLTAVACCTIKPTCGEPVKLAKSMPGCAVSAEEFCRSNCDVNMKN